MISNFKAMDQLLSRFFVSCIASGRCFVVDIEVDRVMEGE